MGGIFSWFKKGTSNKDEEDYVLMLYLAQNELYAYAFNKKNAALQSTVHIVTLDSHLHDLVDKADVLIEKCERDLKNSKAYLRKTVFVLHSSYLTDSQSPKEDVRHCLKKACDELDLENLGYVSTAELYSPRYGNVHDEWVFAEESSHGALLYHMSKTTVKREEHVQLGTDRAGLFEELFSRASGKPTILWILEPLPGLQLPENATFVTTNDLPELFQGLYLKQDSPSSVTPPPVAVVAQVARDFPPAPGFGSVVEELPEAPNKEGETKLFRVPQLRVGRRGWIIIGIVAIVITTIGIVLAFSFHSADVSVVTEKGNFSTTVPIEDNAKNLKEYSGSFSVKESREATGEKVVGEKATGEITVYNRTYQEKSIPAGTKFTTATGISYTTDDAIKIASASGVPVQDGSKSVAATAIAVGPEGNVAKNTKIISSSFPESDVYAVSSKEFSGGYKKTVIVFSQEDKSALKEAATRKVMDEVKQAFKKEKGGSYALLTDTFAADISKEDYSASVNDETRSANLDFSGKYTVQYIPGNELQSLVKQEKLKDKEFVDGTFRIEKIVKKDGEYVAYVAGKVQKDINENELANEIAGKTVTQAKDILSATRATTESNIRIKPIPLPFLPFNASRIKIVTVDSL